MHAKCYMMAKEQREERSLDSRWTDLSKRRVKPQYFTRIADLKTHIAIWMSRILSKM